MNQCGRAGSVLSRCLLSVGLCARCCCTRFAAIILRARLAAAEAALQRATELRPNAAETHLARGSHLYSAFRDYKRALSELEAARAGLPNDPRILEFTGYILRRQGKAKKDYMLWNRRWRSIHAILTCFHSWQLAICTFDVMPEQKATLQRVLEITPDDVGVAGNLCFIDLAWRARYRAFASIH